MDGIRYTPLGYEQLTSISAAVGLGTIPAGANAVLIQAEVQNVRWRDDGTAPTASVGMLVTTNAAVQPFLYTGTLSALLFIQATSGSILNVSYYKISG